MSTLPLVVQIQEAIVTAIGGLSIVGSANVLNVAGRSDDDIGAIGKAIGAGKFAAEILFGDAVTLDGDGQQRIPSSDDWMFECEVLLHLPAAIPADADEDLHTPLRMAAKAVWKGIYPLIAGDPEASPPDSQSDGTWGSLATRSEFLGGGALFVSDIDTRCTTAAFKVFYRNALRGDPS